MFETFQTIINAGGYDLADLTERIKTMYVMGELTEDEMKQLLEQAQDNAKPDNSYAPLADRCARRLPRRRQNHLQREALHVRAGRVRVVSGHLPAGVAGRGMTRIYTGASK